MSGSNNDINVLNHSPLFIDALNGQAPRVQYLLMGGNITHTTTLMMEYTRMGSFCEVDKSTSNGETQVVCIEPRRVQER